MMCFEWYKHQQKRLPYISLKGVKGLKLERLSTSSHCCHCNFVKIHDELKQLFIYMENVLLSNAKTFKRGHFSRVLCFE